MMYLMLKVPYANSTSSSQGLYCVSLLYELELGTSYALLGCEVET